MHIMLWFNTLSLTKLVLFLFYFCREVFSGGRRFSFQLYLPNNISGPHRLSQYKDAIWQFSVKLLGHLLLEPNVKTISATFSQSVGYFYDQVSTTMETTTYLSYNCFLQTIVDSVNLFYYLCYLFVSKCHSHSSCGRTLHQFA